MALSQKNKIKIRRLFTLTKSIANQFIKYRKLSET